jgi:hypothetical protein
MTEKMRDRVLVIGDVVSGFRIHGPLADNPEAFDYVKRHKARFGWQWADNAHAIKLVNFDTMTDAEVAEYENKVGYGWRALEDA